MDENTKAIINPDIMATYAILRLSSANSSKSHLYCMYITEKELLQSETFLGGGGGGGGSNFYSFQGKIVGSH